MREKSQEKRYRGTTWAVDELMGEEEQMGIRRENEERNGASLQPSYPEPFGRFLRPPRNIRWAYYFSPPTLDQIGYIYICIKNRLTVWSLCVVGTNIMEEGVWVEDPLPISFFLSSSVFHSALHPLWAHQLPGMGLSVSPSVPQSLSFSSLFSFLFPWCGWVLTRHWLD